MAKEYSDLLRDRSKWGGEFDSDTPHDGASSMLVPGDAGCPTADKLALVVLLVMEGAALWSGQAPQCRPCPEPASSLPSSGVPAGAIVLEKLFEVAIQVVPKLLLLFKKQCLDST